MSIRLNFRLLLVVPLVLSVLPDAVRAGAAPAGSGFGAALADLSVDEKARFVAGREVFVETEDAADGLGPVFNDNSCVACHSDARGRRRQHARRDTLRQAGAPRRLRRAREPRRLADPGAGHRRPGRVRLRRRDRARRGERHRRTAHDAAVRPRPGRRGARRYLDGARRAAALAYAGDRRPRAPRARRGRRASSTSAASAGRRRCRACCTSPATRT